MIHRPVKVISKLNQTDSDEHMVYGIDLSRVSNTKEKWLRDITPFIIQSSIVLRPEFYKVIQVGRSK